MTGSWCVCGHHADDHSFTGVFRGTKRAACDFCALGEHLELDECPGFEPAPGLPPT